MVQDPPPFSIGYVTFVNNSSVGFDLWALESMFKQNLCYSYLEFPFVYSFHFYLIDGIVLNIL